MTRKKPDDDDDNESLATDDDEVGEEEDDEEMDDDFNEDDMELASYANTRAEDDKPETRQNGCSKKKSPCPIIPSASQDDVTEETDSDSAGAVPTKVLVSYTDIVHLGYYTRDSDKLIKSVEELKKQIADNKRDPTKGVPEELIWVHYKSPEDPSRHDMEPWTEIVIVGQRSMLRKWIDNRKQPKNRKHKRCGIEDHAVAVIERNFLKDNRKHIAKCHELQEVWVDKGLL